MDANNFIVKQLEAEAAAREGYGATALLNSARIIRTFPQSITDAKQLKGVKGIGEGTLKRVAAILAAGDLYRSPAPTPTPVPTTPPQPKVKPFDFTSIKFFGPVACRNLHNQAIHTLEELERRVTAKEIVLQPNQLAGLRYREHLAERIPREEVKEIGDLILEVVKSLGLTGNISGSYRRGKLTSGDVDVLITGPQNLLAQIIQELKVGFIVETDTGDRPFLEYVFSLGEVKFMGVCLGPTSGKHRSLDIRYVPEQIYGAALLFSTGTAAFNVYQRQRAIEQGLKLSEYGLVDKQGITLPARTESEIFAVLGMDYLTPEQREQLYPD